LDEHIGIAISGLTSDARALNQTIFNVALTSRQDMDRPIPVRRLVTMLAEKAQNNTQTNGGRPFGVGILIAGLDDTGPHLYELQPSGNFYEYWGYSIGARSQAARTYFEKFLDVLPSVDLDTLIIHALTALNDCLPPEQKLEPDSCSVGFLGKDQPFKILGTEEISSYLQLLAPRSAPSEAVEEQQPATTEMETDLPPESI
jgi:20S proteasome subunit alpha 6